MYCTPDVQASKAVGLGNNDTVAYNGYNVADEEDRTLAPDACCRTGNNSADTKCEKDYADTTRDRVDVGFEQFCHECVGRVYKVVGSGHEASAD